jgi:ABC-type sugar transport system ATPase subunit
MIIVTHDQMDALAIADRIAVLRDGCLQQIGTPAELYQQPANEFVAGFVGRLRMNFLAGIIAAESGPVLRGDSFTLRLPDQLADRLPAHASQVTLGFRPDAVDILFAPSDDAWMGTIQIAQFQGDQLITTIDIGTAVQVAVPAPVALTIGNTVWLRSKPYATYLFDRRTGERLDAISPEPTRQTRRSSEGVQA